MERIRYPFNTLEVVMRTFSVFVFIAVFAVFSVSASEGHAPDTDKTVFVCEDAENPCLSMDKSGCEGCADLKQKDYVLHTFMETLKQISKLMKDAVREFDREKIVALSRTAERISSEIPNFDPEKNIEKKDDYIKLAQTLGMRASDMAAASEKGDPDVVAKHFRSFIQSCSDCHDSFRK